MTQDPNDPDLGPLAYDPFGGQREADPYRGLPMGPPWLLPLAAGLLVIVFIAVIVVLYWGAGPRGGAQDGVIPVIRAEDGPLRTRPPAGEDAPDSAVYETFGAPESLLSDDPQPVDPQALAAFEREAARMRLEMEGGQVVSVEVITPDNAAQPEEASALVAPETAPEAPPTVVPPPRKPVKPAITAVVQAAGPEEAAPAPTASPETGASEETLDFVRSVLGEEGAAPADPPAKPAPTQTGNKNFYVQLGSVTSAAGAASEWAKLHATFASELGSGVGYRVEEADLGARGTYHRIQAGPYTEDRARAACDAIKARKPGGCLVVKR